MNHLKRGQSTGATDFIGHITFRGSLPIVNPVSSIFHILWPLSCKSFLDEKSSVICEPLVHTFMSHFWSWSLKKSFLSHLNFLSMPTDKSIIPCVTRSVIFKWCFSFSPCLQNFELSLSHQVAWVPYPSWPFQTSTQQWHFLPHEKERVMDLF